MKRPFFFFALFALLFSVQCLMAAPLRNVEVRLTQPNGEVIHCFASGDEFYNYLHDADGFTIVKGEGGYYFYATYDGDGQVVPSAYKVNSVTPATVGLQPKVLISEQEYYARRQEREQYLKQPQRSTRENNHGRYNNLVVFIRFAGDSYHTTPASAVDSMFNASNYESISLRNFYHRASYNQLDLRSYLYPIPDGETILSYEDIYPKEYYMPYDPETNPIGYQNGETADREFSMLERAIYYVADQVSDTLDLDYNDDGLVDNVVFVIKGTPGEWASLLWPHRWCIYDRYVPLKDLQVFDFNLQLEQGGYFNVSTLCHEMCHSLGAPDLYHYNGGVDPVGSWDLMCGTAEPPQQQGSYIKYKYGNWIEDIPEIDAYGTYELEAVSWEGNRRNAYKIRLNADQWLLLEYRNDHDLFDSHVPDGGLLIYRIDTRFDGNAGWNGEDQFDEVYLFRPDGDVNEAGNLDHANFCEERNRTEFSRVTNPFLFLTNGEPIDWQGAIYDISERGDRLSFTYGPLNHIAAPTHFIAHVNSLSHQVELSWDAMPDVDGYNVYRDGLEVATHLTETTYVQPYTDADDGYHTYYVASYHGDTLSDYAEQWVILGNYETIHVTLTCDSPYGTKGGELEVVYSIPEMKSQYLTIYEGTKAEADLYVPANTEVSFFWDAGFDAESQGIRVTATHQNENGEGTIFDIESPEDILAIYTVADTGLGLMPPQNLVAESEGTDIRLRWTVPTENSRFTVYRGSRVCQSDVTGYAYLDDQIMRSGTYGYHVENNSGDLSTWCPEHVVYATAMNYYCEPPRNLAGTYDGNGHVALTWEAPEFVGNGLMGYDNNRFAEQIGTNSHKWGIKIEPEHLALFAGHPIAYLEMFDCSAGHYTYTIHNGETVNNSTLIYTQQHDMEGTYAWVRFPLDEAVSYDASMPLWVCVATTGATHPIPCCEYVGEPNSCLIKSGSQWKPVTTFGQNVSWLLRAYTTPAEGRSFSYNLYWGPEEGGEEQLVLGYEGLTVTEAAYNTTENMRYNVTTFWDGRETDFSNTVYLGPSVAVPEHNDEGQGLVVYPNPVKGLLTLQGKEMRHVSLYSAVGTLIDDRDVAGDHVELVMERLPEGLYLLHVTTAEGVMVMKVVKR